METITTSTHRIAIVHGENAEFGYSYTAPRGTADEAFADRDRLAADPFFLGLEHKIEFVVVKTTTTTTKVGLSSAEITLSAPVTR